MLNTGKETIAMFLMICTMQTTVKRPTEMILQILFSAEENSHGTGKYRMQQMDSEAQMSLDFLQNSNF